MDTEAKKLSEASNVILAGSPTFRVSQVPPYRLGEIASDVATLRKLGRDVIDLSQMNPDLPPPALAVEKLIQSILRPHNHRYSASQGIKRLREVIVARYAAKFGVSLDVDSEVCATLGNKEGIAHFLLSVLHPGESVVVPLPAYPVHTAGVCLVGGTVLGIALDSKESFFERLTSLLDHAWPRPRLMLLNFPHNPTTATVTREFWTGLVDIARRYNLWLANDFAYGEVTFAGPPAASLLSAPGAKDVGVEFYSLSKSISAPGWRIGWCVGNPEAIAALKKLKSYVDFGAFQPLQIAAAAATEDLDTILDEVLPVYRARKELLETGLETLGWKVDRTESTSLVWARMPPQLEGRDSISLARELLQRCDIAISPGAGFGAEGEGYMRFALVESESRIQVVLDRLQEFQSGRCLRSANCN